MRYPAAISRYNIARVLTVLLAGASAAACSHNVSYTKQVNVLAPGAVAPAEDAPITMAPVVGGLGRGYQSSADVIAAYDDYTGEDTFTALIPSFEPQIGLGEGFQVASADLPPLPFFDEPIASSIDDPLERSAAYETAQLERLILAQADTRRRRPGQRGRTRETDIDQIYDGAVPPPLPSTYPEDEIPIPDRWRLVEAIGVNERWWDPYRQNTLKGDRPIWKTDDWFVVLAAISDTVVEPRSFPLPVGVQTTNRSGSLDVFGDANSFLFVQNLITSISFIKGSTAYKPQDLEFRLTPVFNYNYAQVEELRVLYVEPSRGTTRSDAWIGLQEAFVDYHIRNVSDRYDFDSVRAGIQPFSTDFRGFLFQDSQLGIRFFGNRDNNRYQYNLAAFWRLAKDTNSGLNDVTVKPRDDYFFVANLYRQDFPYPGLTSQVTAVYNMNREKGDITVDDNGFPVRPALIGTNRARDYDVVYLGYNADGRVGRLNLTASAYFAIGEERDSVFTGNPSTIRSFFLAVEPSYDFNWTRVRFTGLYASGDSDPYDDKSTGFDAIFENPLIGGADTSYWIRQGIPFLGGGRAVSLNGRNGVLPSLRSTKEQGQSSFINPGITMVGAGADFDVLPELRVSANVNYLRFNNTSSLEALRVQGDIPKSIGLDLSAALIYRPFFTQNVVARLSGAVLKPGDGFKALFANNEKRDLYKSILFNLVLTY